MSDKPISHLRRRMIEDMTVRQFGEKTKHDYIRHVESFTNFLGRSPDTATAEDVRRFQVHQTESGVQPPTHEQRGLGAAVLLRHHARTAPSWPAISPACTTRRSCRACSRPRRWAGCSRRHPARPEVQGGA